MRRWNRALAVAALGLAGMLAAPTAARAGGGHGHHGHGHHHGGSKVVIGVGVAPGFWWGGPYGYYGYGRPYGYYPYAYPYPYPYPYYYPSPVVVSPPAVEQPVYVERTPAPQSEPSYWYYCESAEAYYPDAATCPEPWVRVPPRSE